jgi:hypothetical protein
MSYEDMQWMARTNPAYSAAIGQLGSNAPDWSVEQYARNTMGGKYTNPVDVYVNMLQNHEISLEQIPEEYRGQVYATPAIKNAYGSFGSVGETSNVGNLINNMGLSSDWQAMFQSQLQAHPEAAMDVLGLAQSQYGVESQKKLSDEARAKQEAQLGRITGLETEGKSFYDPLISKYQGFLANPSSIRSDAELSKQLAATEAALDQQVSTARTTASRTLADTGLRAAGKVVNPVRQAELGAAYGKAQNMSDLLGRIQGGVTELQGNRLNFLQGIESQRGAAESGGTAQLAGLQESIKGLTPDYFKPQGTSIDISGLGKSQTQWDQSQALQWASLIMSTLQNMGQQGSQMMSSFMPGKK